MKRISLCLDNDKWGIAAAESIRDKYTGKGYAVETVLPPAGKDWNAYLSQRHQPRERGR